MLDVLPSVTPPSFACPKHRCSQTLLGEGFETGNCLLVEGF